MLDFPASPATGQTYTGPNSAVWQYDGVKWNAGAAALAQNNNVGRNLLDNAQFNINQRGMGPWTTNAAYTADRWRIGFTSDTMTADIVLANDTTRSQIGDEAASYVIRLVFTGNAAAGAFSSFQQVMEGVRRLAGKTVTISFYAAALSGTPKIGINLFQYFGSGGSPSASGWVTTTGSNVTLSTTWARYSVILAIPSVAGKTLGTNNDDSTQLTLWLSSGATNNNVAGIIGVQSATVYFWGVQLEIGSVATPLDKPNPQADLARCQRFYQAGQMQLAGYGLTAAVQATWLPFPVPMRASPTMAPTFLAAVNGEGGYFTPGTGGYNWGFTVTTTGAFNVYGTWTATADL